MLRYPDLYLINFAKVFEFEFLFNFNFSTPRTVVDTEDPADDTSARTENPATSKVEPYHYKIPWWRQAGTIRRLA